MLIESKNLEPERINVDELRLKLAVMHNVAPVQLNYSKTMALLYALKAGTVTLDQIVLDGETWQLLDVKVEAAPVNSEPMTAEEFRRREGLPEVKEAPEG